MTECNIRDLNLWQSRRSEQKNYKYKNKKKLFYSFYK